MEGYWATLGMLVQPAYFILTNILLVFALRMMRGMPYSLALAI